MKVNWFNDKKHRVFITIETLNGKSYPVKPQELCSFDYDLPEGKELYIKQWDNGLVLFGSIDPIKRDK